MKRIISLLLVFCTVFSLVPATVFAADDNQGALIDLANPFNDVEENNWFYQAVQYARINGFFNGISNAKFDPDGAMTRGMFVTVLGRMAGVDAGKYKDQSAFKDVPASAYYAPYVAWAAKHGITTGMGDGNFFPNALINRQQMATFLARYFEAFDVDYDTDENITTLPADMGLVASWAQDSVRKLWAEGLLNGDGINFNPEADASRAQAAAVAMRADQAVDIWYKEPGVPSDRIRINPATGLPYEGVNGGTPDNDNLHSSLTDAQLAVLLGMLRTVTYTDGVAGDVVFEDQSYTRFIGSSTPDFDSTPVREGYIFIGWNPEISATVTSNVTYTAQWKASIITPDPVYYTVTYTDGVADETIFADQTTSVEEGSATPAFIGTISREGYTFNGWSPSVVTTVTGNVVYTAQWEKIAVVETTEVIFHLSAETTETRSVAVGTPIKNLPIPYAPQKLFLGWYYNSTLTEMAESTDVVSENLHLYAKYIDQEVNDSGSPNFVSAEDQSADFIVRIQNVNGDPITGADYRLINVTDSDRTDGTDDVEQDILVYDNGILSALNGFREGHTYQIELLNDDIVFVVEGVQQDPAVRFFNFNIFKEDVLSLELADGIYYIFADDPTDALSDDDAEKMLKGSGLVQLTLDGDGQGSYSEVENNGTFTFTEGEFDVGDLVSVYRGIRPDLRETTSGEDESIYVEIIAVNGSLYTYQAADATDVLHLPDVLPLPANFFTGSSFVQLPKTALDFSIYSEMGYDSNTEINKGDFLALYDGAILQTSTTVSYVRVVDVEDNGDSITVTYVAATEDDIYASADMYLKRSLTDEELDAAMADEQLMEQLVLNQLSENNFGEEMGNYLASLVLQTDEVKEYFGEELDLSDVLLRFVDRSQDTDGIKLMGQLVGIGGDGKPELKVNLTKKLSHYEDMKGVRSEVIMTYEFEIRKADSDKQLNVELEAFFEQEVLFDLVAEGEATWGKIWFVPYLKQYRIGGHLDLGTYTGIGISAVATLAEKEEPWGMPWPKNNAQAGAARNIVDLSESIKKLMDTKEKLEAGNDVGAGEGLQETYKSFLEDANEAWIDIFEVKLFETEIMLDPAHICVLGVEANFVVSANLNVGLGMTMSYQNSKRFTFNIKLLSLSAKFDSVDLEAEAYTFDCYVMGTMGIRAGVRLSFTLGIVTTKLAEAGINIELGAYAQFWGYFYYSYNWEKGAGKDSEYSGAIFAELGAYTTIGLEGSVVCGLLEFDMDIINVSIPLIHVGWRENVYDFAYEEDNAPSCNFAGSATFTLPDTIFAMKYMDMTTGEDEERSFDTKYGVFDWISDKIHGDPAGDAADDEEYFVIELSNPVFSYNPKKNKITVDATVTGELEQSSEMRITWIRSPLTFSSETLSRTIVINWSNPGSYVSFDSLGGEIYAPIIKVAGTNISALKPSTEPVREGYTFKGWCSNQTEGHEHDDYTKCTITAVPDVMPKNPMVLSACWEPNDAEYTVEHYLEALDGQYVLAEEATQVFVGKTRDLVSIKPSSFDGFTVRKDSVAKSLEVLPGGNAVCKLYYTRNSYQLIFDRGLVGGTGMEFTIKHGAALSAPQLKEPGYTFVGFADLPETMPIGDSTYVAQWKTNTYTITFDSDGGTAVESITQLYKSPVTAPVAPTKEGYVFDTWLLNGQPFDFTTMPLGGANLVAKWSGAQSYVVEIYRQEADGTYTLDLHDTTRSANIGDTVSAQDFDLNKYGESDGYYLDTSIPETNLSDVIGAEPVTLKLYFTRYTYTLTYIYDSDAYIKPKTPAPITLRWGERVTLDAPVFNGQYSVKTWTAKMADKTEIVLGEDNTFVMPKSNVSATAIWDYITYRINYHYVVYENGEEIPQTDIRTYYEKDHALGSEVSLNHWLGMDKWGIMEGTDASGNTVQYLFTGWTDADGNPVTSFAADYTAEHFYAAIIPIPGYLGLRVGGVAVTESNKNDVLGDGTVRFDPATATLTLDEADLDGYVSVVRVDKKDYTVCYNILLESSLGKNFTIQLNGKNTATVHPLDYMATLVCDLRTGTKNSLNFAGTSSATDSLAIVLSEESNNWADIVKGKSKISWSDVTLNISDCSMDIGTSIRNSGNCTIKNSNITARDYFCVDDTTMTNSVVTVEKSRKNYSDEMNVGDLTLDNTILTVTNDMCETALYTKYLTIKNGSKMYINHHNTYSESITTDMALQVRGVLEITGSSSMLEINSTLPDNLTAGDSKAVTVDLSTYDRFNIKNGATFNLNVDATNTNLQDIEYCAIYTDTIAITGGSHCNIVIHGNDNFKSVHAMDLWNLTVQADSDLYALIDGTGDCESVCVYFTDKNDPDFIIDESTAELTGGSAAVIIEPKDVNGNKTVKFTYVSAVTGTSAATAKKYTNGQAFGKYFKAAPAN